MGGPPSVDPRQALPGPYREPAPYSPAQVPSPAAVHSVPFSPFPPPCTPELRPSLGSSVARRALQLHRSVLA